MTSPTRTSTRCRPPRSDAVRLESTELVATLRAAGCVFAEDEARLLLSAATAPPELAALVERRVAGLPLEQILGWAEFCGLRVTIDPGVFVPRRRTELLVREAVAVVGSGVAGPGPVVVDLCCGSGAVGAALLAAVPGVEIHAVDIDAAAVRCARANLPGCQVHQGDLDGPLPETLRGHVDLVVAIAPYVPTDAIATMPPEARLHEPRAALDGGVDGLDLVRRVIVAAPRWLRPGGHLIVETGEGQATRAVAAVVRNGLVGRIVTCDDLYATVVVGTLI